MIKTLFGGRINRKEYFLALVLSFVSIAAAGIVLGIVVKVIFQDAQWVGTLAGGAFVAFIILFTIKRLHDIGWSGWWSLLLFPLAPFVVLYLLIVEGHNTSNQYGVPPADRKFSFLQILFNTSSAGKVTTVQNPVASRASFSSNKIAILSVLAVSPLGAALPLYWFSIMGWCKVVISFGESACAIPVIGGYFEGVQEWFAVVSLATLGLGSIIWLLAAAIVWALLCISLIGAAHQSGKRKI